MNDWNNLKNYIKYTCFEGRQHCKQSVFLAVKIQNLFAATVALFGAGNRTLKEEFFERPGKNLQNSYLSFDYEKCAGIMSSGVCTWPDFRFFKLKLGNVFPSFSG